MTFHSLCRIAIAFLPLAATPLLIHVLAEGYFDPGGGEKDLVLVIPWFLWSVLFAVGSLVLWRRGRSLPAATIASVFIGFAGLLLSAAVLAVFGRLGVAGLF